MKHRLPDSELTPKQLAMRRYQHEYSIKHREKKRLVAMQYYAANKDRAKQYRKDNAEVIAASEKAYLNNQEVKARRAKNARKRRHANPQPDREVCKRWRAKNPDKVLHLNRTYRARSWRAHGTASKVQIAARIAYYGGLCAYCGLAPGECIDHAIPLLRGGTHWPANLYPACLACNSSKRDRTPAEYRLYLQERDLPLHVQRLAALQEAA